MQVFGKLLIDHLHYSRICLRMISKYRITRKLKKNRLNWILRRYFIMHLILIQFQLRLILYLIQIYPIRQSLHVSRYVNDAALLQ